MRVRYVQRSRLVKMEANSYLLLLVVIYWENPAR